MGLKRWVPAVGQRGQINPAGLNAGSATAHPARKRRATRIFQGYTLRILKFSHRALFFSGILGLISACSSSPALAHDNTDTPKAEKAEPAKPEHSAPFYWFWSDGPADQPPKATPYELPTLAGDGVDFHAKPVKPVKAPHIDADAVYRYVLECFPEKSRWNLDVSLRAQLARSRSNSASVTDYTDDTALGSSYVAIVANMPIYSATELSRQKDREYKRRMDVAGTVSNFITSIASRNHAVRELALYRSLEARSALRVKQGIVEVTEQVGYLEKVAGAQSTLVKQEANIMESRLKLAGMCDPVNADRINRWLLLVSSVPGKRPTLPHSGFKTQTRKPDPRPQQQQKPAPAKPLAQTQPKPKKGHQHLHRHPKTHPHKPAHNHVHAHPHVHASTEAPGIATPPMLHVRRDTTNP